MDNCEREMRLGGVTVEDESNEAVQSGVTDHVARLRKIFQMRENEINLLTQRIQEQETVMQELTKNRNDIYSQIRMQELNIEEEKKNRQQCLDIFEQQKQTMALVNDQLEKTNLVYDAFDNCHRLYQRLRAPLDQNLAEFFELKAEAEAAVQLIDSTKEKVDAAITSGQEANALELKEQLQEINMMQGNASSLLIRLKDTGHFDGVDKTWLERLGHSESVVDTIGQLSKAVSIALEKNKSLKKRKSKRKDAGNKCEAEICELTTAIDALRAHCNVIKDDWLTNLETENALVSSVNQINNDIDAVERDSETLLVKSIIPTIEAYERAIADNDDLLVGRDNLAQEVKLLKTSIDEDMTRLALQSSQLDQEQAKLDSERIVMSVRILEIQEQTKTMISDTAREQKWIEEIEEEINAINKCALENTTDRLDEDIKELISSINVLRKETNLCKNRTATLELPQKTAQLEGFIKENIVKDKENAELEQMIPEWAEKLKESRKRHMDSEVTLMRLQRIREIFHNSDKDRQIIVAECSRIEDDIAEIERTKQNENNGLRQVLLEAQNAKESVDVQYVKYKNEIAKLEDEIPKIELEILELKRESLKINMALEKEKHVSVELSYKLRGKRQEGEERAKNEDKLRKEKERQQKESERIRKKQTELKTRAIQEGAGHTLGGSARWMTRLADVVPKIKQERTDDDLSTPVVQPPASKKFFKSRRTLPSKSLPKRKEGNPSVYDFEGDDDDCQIVYIGDKEKSSPKKKKLA